MKYMDWCEKHRWFSGRNVAYYRFRYDPVPGIHKYRQPWESTYRTFKNFLFLLKDADANGVWIRTKRNRKNLPNADGWENPIKNVIFSRSWKETKKAKQWA